MDNKVILRFQIMRVYLIYPLLTKAGIFAVIFCTLFLICFSSGFVHADNPIVEQKKQIAAERRAEKIQKLEEKEEPKTNNVRQNLREKIKERVESKNERKKGNTDQKKTNQQSAREALKEKKQEMKKRRKEKIAALQFIQKTKRSCIRKHKDDKQQRALCMRDVVLEKVKSKLKQIREQRLLKLSR
jgi:hypothetical protein